MAAPLLGRGQTFETSVSEYSTPMERGGVGGCRGVAGTGKSRRNRQEWRRPTGGWNELYCAVRHVSFFLIIIFNPIHCTVQQFALTPSYEILQGSLSDENIHGAVGSSLLLILGHSRRLESHAFSSAFHNFFLM